MWEIDTLVLFKLHCSSYLASCNHALCNLGLTQDGLLIVGPFLECFTWCNFIFFLRSYQAYLSGNWYTPIQHMLRYFKDLSSPSQSGSMSKLFPAASNFSRLIIGRMLKTKTSPEIITNRRCCLLRF